MTLRTVLLVVDALLILAIIASAGLLFMNVL